MKLGWFGLSRGGVLVAPHAGAWIETPTAEARCWAVSSPPTRGRGLKREIRSRRA